MKIKYTILLFAYLRALLSKDTRRTSVGAINDERKVMLLSSILLSPHIQCKYVKFYYVTLLLSAKFKNQISEMVEYKYFKFFVSLLHRLCSLR